MQQNFVEKPIRREILPSRPVKNNLYFEQDVKNSGLLLFLEEKKHLRLSCPKKNLFLLGYFIDFEFKFFISVVSFLKQIS